MYENVTKEYHRKNSSQNQKLLKEYECEHTHQENNFDLKLDKSLAKSIILVNNAVDDQNNSNDYKNLYDIRDKSDNIEDNNILVLDKYLNITPDQGKISKSKKIRGIGKKTTNSRPLLVYSSKNKKQSSITFIVRRLHAEEKQR
jgi:hypothetical protein